MDADTTVYVRSDGMDYRKYCNHGKNLYFEKPSDFLHFVSGFQPVFQETIPGCNYILQCNDCFGNDVILCCVIERTAIYNI